MENHSEATCWKIFRSPTALAMWNQLWAEGILLIRTYAFLGNRMWVVIFLGTLLCGVVGYQLYVDVAQMTLLPFLDPANGGPCFPTVKYAGSPHIMAFFLAALIFDTIVTCMTLHRAWQLRRAGGGRGSPLLKTFVQEGIWYFLLISAANLANAIFYWQPNGVMSALLIPLSVIFPDIVVCRMILSLRSRGVRHTSEHTPSTHGQYSHTTRNFKVTNKVGGGAPANIAKGSGADGSGKDAGTITNMGFNHEMTTFRPGAAPGDSDSVIGRDIKAVPYEMEEERERGLTAGGIRVDIESTKYYEERSDGEDERKGRSFMT